MPEPLFTVQCRLKIGAGLRGAAWYDHATMPESEAEAYCRAMRLSNDLKRQDYWWRIVPTIKVRFKGRVPLPNAAKGLQRAFQVARKIDMDFNTGFNGAFDVGRHKEIIVRMGGAR